MLIGLSVENVKATWNHEILKLYHAVQCLNKVLKLCLDTKYQQRKDWI